MYRSLPAITGCARNGARSAPTSSTCSAVTRDGSTNGSLATQFSPHRPYFDPSVATSTFMLRILSFAWTIHEYLLRRPILSPGGAVLVRPPGRTASTSPSTLLASSPGGLRSRTPRDGIHE